MKLLPRTICPFIFVLSLTPSLSSGSTLSHLVSDIEGSTITFEKKFPYINKRVLVGISESGYIGKDIKGSVSSVTYDIPTTLTELDVVNQYYTALAQSGFQVLTECSGFACGSVASMSSALNIEAPLGYDENQEFRSFVLKNDVFITLYSTGYNNKRILNVQLTQRKQNTSTIKVNQKTINLLIDEFGQVDIPNINFKFNSDELLETSHGSIQEVANYLNGVPDYHFYIVGHTDDTGSAEYNYSLSEKRANKIKEVLILLGVDKIRLTAIGIGEYSPLENNATEKGRQNNRRVTLVKRTDLL